MSLAEFLRTKSGEYELLAEWHAERTAVDDQHFVVCQAMLVVGIVLREVASDRPRIGGGAGRLRPARTSRGVGTERTRGAGCAARASCFAGVCR